MTQAAFLMTVVDMVSLHPDQWSDRKRIYTWSEGMAEPGPRNLITDVPGLLVGQAEDEPGITGTSVVLCETPAVASVDVRGGAPGSRETELLDPAALVERVDAIVLSGGSAFGLDAAAGVMGGLAAIGRGFAMRDVRVPIVPAAILFDLAFPGRQPWTGEPPYRGLGRLALDRVAADFALGNAGAGRGAKAGQLKGGIGSASLRLANGAAVGALVAVNSWGGVVPGACDHAGGDGGRAARRLRQLASALGSASAVKRRYAAAFNSGEIISPDSGRHTRTRVPRPTSLSMRINPSC